MAALSVLVVGLAAVVEPVADRDSGSGRIPVVEQTCGRSWFYSPVPLVVAIVDAQCDLADDVVAVRITTIIAESVNSASGKFHGERSTTRESACQF
jgi:hypothetical protein